MSEIHDSEVQPDFSSPIVNAQPGVAATSAISQPLAITSLLASIMNDSSEMTGRERHENADLMSATTEILRHRERQIDAIRLMNEALYSFSSLDNILREMLHVALEVLEAKVGSVQMYEANKNALIFRYAMETHIIGMETPISQGINGRVYRTGISDLTRHVRESADWNRNVDDKTGYHTESMMTVALRGNDGKPIGVVQVLNSTRAHDQRDLEVLEVLCGQASNAIVNARLLEDATRRLNHLQALQSIDAAITSTHDIDLKLDVFVEKIVAQLDLDAVDVLLFNPHMLTLKYAAGNGFRTPEPSCPPLRLGQGYAGRAALERCIVSAPHLRAGEMANFVSTPSHYTSEPWASYFAVPLITRGQVKGVLEAFNRTPINPTPEWLALLETLSNQAAIAIDNAELFGDLQRSHIELAIAYDTTLEGWSRALDLRDKETEGHTQRVTDTTLLLARQFGMRSSDMIHVRRGALLHDIGKMGIPDSILLKPGPLDDEEWEVMRRHPVYAMELLSHIPYLKPSLDIPYCHHEKWDGSGYPRGIRNEQIPLSARLFAVVDVWDALRSDRPYRSGWPMEKVLEHIRQGSGSHFDSQAVEAFLSLDLG